MKFITLILNINKGFLNEKNNFKSYFNNESFPFWFK